MPNLAVLDIETDPFEHGRIVQPFLAGFHDGTRTISYWSEDCISRLVDTLAQESKEWVIYAHNGGRFDFFYFLPHLTGKGGTGNDMRIINGRIVQARLGKHELRDSFAIMPFALKDYDKDVIDYSKFESHCRESHRDEIEKYFRRDLTSLYELVTAFHAEFGDKLTIGSASMKELKKFHKYDTGSQEYDAKFRKDFYFGGRNQVFKGGIIRGSISVIDVRSMYPAAMRNQIHPTGTVHNVSKRVERNSVFVVAEGHNYGAFPTREKNNSLNFCVPYGVFSCTIHEWHAALETGTFKPTRIIKSYTWEKQETFDTFIDHFFNKRNTAIASGDLIRKIFYKFVLNSAYGKFAQNPDNYHEWFITPYGELPKDWHECGKGCNEPCEKLWRPAYIFETAYTIWKKPLATRIWYNIATGASITGAARAILLKGICATKEPLYCDTDSIICRGRTSLSLHDSGLGSWQLEATGQMAAIAGKKLYAVFDKSGTCVKKAHKGARLSPDEIVKITEGEIIQTENPVPSFKWDGSATFTRRKIRRTAA